MNLDLVSSLGITNALPLKKFLLATKDDKCDLGFVFLDVLGYLLKKNFSLLMVNFAQSFNHYHHLMSKNCVNLKSLRESGRLIAVDVLGSTEQIITNSDLAQNEPSEYTFLLNDSSSNMKDLFDLIEKGVNSLKTQDQSGFVIFIDEVSILHNLCISCKEIQKLLHYCRTICMQEEGVLVIGSHIDSYDEDSIRFMTYLCHTADMTVHIEGLSTGYSKDVHGKLWYNVKDDKRSNSKTHVLFRVEEKGVKLLPLGM